MRQSASPDILILALVLLIGFALRVGLASGDQRFHPDEALFSTFARRAALNGDWLLHGDLDKPPLSIYANAFSMLLFAARPRETVLDFTPLQGEFAARLPSLFASLITIAAAYSTGRRLFPSSQRALWTALLIVASPLSIVFSATAFTDGLMICSGVLAARAASGGRWSWAGFWLGVAFAAKQQAIFFLPLILLLGWLVDRLSVGRLFRFAVPLMLWVIFLVVWDESREQSTGFWALATANNEVSRFIRADEFIPRLTQWSIYLLTIAGAISLLLIALFIFSGHSAIPREKRIDHTLLIYALAYLTLNMVVAFNIYDRYALILLLPLTLLGSRGAAWLTKLWQGKNHDQRMIRYASWGVLSCISVLMLWSGWNAANGQALVGGDAGGGRWGYYADIDALAEYLNAKPVATVIYDRWLGWELGFYMGEWTDKRRVHFPTPLALGDGAAALQEIDPRYLVAPIRERVSPWLDVLRDHGFVIQLERSLTNFTVYRVDPPTRP